MARNDDLPAAGMYHLEPGFVYGCRHRTIIRTVLGSCVAVTLWHPQSRTGAMCHYLFPTPGKNNQPTACFGNVAIKAMLSLMHDFGCPTQQLAAQVYGGARPSFDTTSSIGDDNVRMAQRMLSRHGIPFASEDTGGVMGRKILFDTWSGETVVMKVHSLRSGDWH